jgi:farnesyl-diphosphate farnesyltransferase
MVTEDIAVYDYTRSMGQEPLSGPLENMSDAALQAHLLQGVSRTFALTIPQLPPQLTHVVANAYLLCRTIDTIEDEPTLSWSDKQRFCHRFMAALKGTLAPESFASQLASQLSERTPWPERELVQYAPRVIGITHSLTASQQDALIACVQAMGQGMVEFQATGSLNGLQNLQQLDRYCYYVAGVVGEMLTKLFCEYSLDIAARKEQLMALAVSFGQGLQMTNILKDIWDDRQRGVCWLPQAEFTAAGFDLKDLSPKHYCEGFGRGLERLIGIAHAHLRNALAYTLLIPKHETDIRRFCLLALGLAVLTLRKINNQRDFNVGSQVKISRRSVQTTMTVNRLIAKQDYLLRGFFRWMSVGLPLHNTLCSTYLNSR